VRFFVLTEVAMEIIVSRDVTQCTLVDIYRRFGSLKMEAARFYQIAWRNIPEDNNHRLCLRFRGKREDTEKSACTVKFNQGNSSSAS
jgi:hypothetical protein